MEQGLKSKVAIIGGGPAGCICAYFLQNNFDVVIFDKKPLLTTILPTGGGRCNLANAEFDFKSLAENYPRGEKFLYSVFSKFSTNDTIEFFEKIGIKTYIQDDLRIFPISNSSKNVREKFLKALHKVKFINEEVLKINHSDTYATNDKEFNIITNKDSYSADYVVVATGGHSSFEFVKNLGHNIILPKPSLTALRTREDFSPLSGVSVGGILFTHSGISGPKVYELSALNARKDFPYKLCFNFINDDVDFQAMLNNNPHKSIKNLLASFVPKSFGEFVLNELNINPDIKSCNVDGKIRDLIINRLKNFEIEVVGTVIDSEVVMSGGIDLNEVNSKTMESKVVNGLYFCGEVLDIDGFCGGFNLQNCWSTGFVAAEGIAKIN